MPKTSGLIIIGDELLNGDVTDTNSSFLCRRLNSLGTQVCKICIIPDNVHVIAEEIAKFSASFDVVITTGGVGPTHDDVTYEGTAAAFSTCLVINKQLEKYYSNYLKEEKNDSSYRLVSIPSNAEVILVNFEVPLESNISKFPVVKTHNVFNFPGIPSYTQAIFNSIEKKYFQNMENIFFSRNVYLNVDEIFVVSILNELVTQFKNKVTFGSYPIIDNKRIINEMTKITIKSTFLSDCLDAENVLISKIAPGWLVYLNPALPNFDIIRRLPELNFELSNVIRISSQIIEDCFSKYDISDTFISFNGGKDSTVLLNLIYCYCLTKKIEKPLKLVYFKEQDSFTEIDSFIEDIKNNYCIDLRILPMPMKNSLKKFLKTESSIKISFLGLRKADPNGKNVKPVQETDSDWPKLVRIFPLLHWSYKNVWDFLRCANVPYCSLYNEGYTSLGAKSNTSVNSGLKFVSKCDVYYKPAFLLHEDITEREGRC